MSWWNKDAEMLQQLTIKTEGVDGVNYVDGFVNKMIVHSRQDLILIYSQLSSLNLQIYTIKVLLIVILLTLLFIASTPFIL
ncbi:hypothetical protein N9D56_01080 [Methylophilaceae bacterium]|jgi:hypothetical protein|nr:hypothetical protein [Methylophilaceae bacterium]